MNRVDRKGVIYGNVVNLSTICHSVMFLHGIYFVEQIPDKNIPRKIHGTGGNDILKSVLLKLTALNLWKGRTGS